ncbi:unnamed protein product [Schistosoma rodhaini]|uniref:Uncharacterized protein n=1 Tax=Schistosoma rodhaini TaxID=6188 RepID=A0AA85FQ81_9TREM|nr:unnamed protein product [Schistosoma rodhaini]
MSLLSNWGGINYHIHYDFLFVDAISVGAEVDADAGIKAGLDVGAGIKAGLGVGDGAGIKAGLGLGDGVGIKAGLGVGDGVGIKAGLGLGDGVGIKAGLGVGRGARIGNGLIIGRGGYRNVRNLLIGKGLGRLARGTTSAKRGGETSGGSGGVESSRTVKREVIRDPGQEDSEETVQRKKIVKTREIREVPVED